MFRIGIIGEELPDAGLLAFVVPLRGEEHCNANGFILGQTQRIGDSFRLLFDSTDVVRQELIFLVLPGRSGHENHD